MLRQIPQSFESRLSKHLSNEKIFKKPTQIYQEVLHILQAAAGCPT